MMLPLFLYLPFNWVYAICQGHPRWLSSKQSTYNEVVTGGAGSIPGSGRSPGEGHSNPLQYSCLENSMDRGAWRTTVHGVAKSWTQLKWLSMHTCTHSPGSVGVCFCRFRRILTSPCCRWGVGVNGGCWRGDICYPADLAPEGTPDKEFVSLIQEVSHCAVCMEIRKASSRYHRRFTLSLIFEWIISVHFTTSGVSFLPSSGSPIFLKLCHTFYTLLHFTRWMLNCTLSRKNDSWHYQFRRIKEKLFSFWICGHSGV